MNRTSKKKFTRKQSGHRRVNSKINFSYKSDSPRRLKGVDPRRALSLGNDSSMVKRKREVIDLSKKMGKRYYSPNPVNKYKDEDLAFLMSRLPNDIKGMIKSEVVKDDSTQIIKNAKDTLREYKSELSDIYMTILNDDITQEAADELENVLLPRLENFQGRIKTVIRELEKSKSKSKATKETVVLDNLVKEFRDLYSRLSFYKRTVIDMLQGILNILEYVEY